MALLCELLLAAGGAAAGVAAVLAPALLSPALLPWAVMLVAAAVAAFALSSAGRHSLAMALLAASYPAAATLLGLELGGPWSILASIVLCRCLAVEAWRECSAGGCPHHGEALEPGGGVVSAAPASTAAARGRPPLPPRAPAAKPAPAQPVSPPSPAPVAALPAPPTPAPAAAQPAPTQPQPPPEGPPELDPTQPQPPPEGPPEGDPLIEQLMHAAEAGDAAGVAAALAAGANPNGVLVASGHTALHAACFYGQLACAQQLLAAGADPDAEAEHGEFQCTPLQCAVEGRQPELVAALLAAGADFRARSSGAVRLACIYGHACLELFLEAGLDPNTTIGDRGFPLHYASTFGNADGAALLLDAGADPTAVDSEGCTPLHSVAGWSQDAHVVRLLLAALE